nr:MAG TPA: hypothetical protein [Caudoviricetes sp.]
MCRVSLGSMPSITLIIRRCCWIIMCFIMIVVMRICIRFITIIIIISTWVSIVIIYTIIRSPSIIIITSPIYTSRGISVQC